MSEILSLSAVGYAAAKNYRIVGLCVLVSMLIAILYVHSAAPQYEASMVIAPTSASLADDQVTSGIGLSGGLSSLLGGGAGQMPRGFAELTNLTSANFLAATLLADDRVKQGVYPAIWDATERQWKPPSGVMNSLKGAIRKLLGMPGWHPPTPQDLSGYLAKNVLQTDVPETDLRRISYRNTDPAFATYLIGKIYTLLDQSLKSRSTKRHAANIAYINQAINKTTSTDLRSAIIALYAQEERRMMLSSSDLPFTADMIDPPTAGTTPVSPALPVVYGAAILLGLLFGVLASVYWESRSR